MSDTQRKANKCKWIKCCICHILNRRDEVITDVPRMCQDSARFFSLCVVGIHIPRTGWVACSVMGVAFQTQSCVTPKAHFFALPGADTLIR